MSNVFLIKLYIQTLNPNATYQIKYIKYWDRHIVKLNIPAINQINIQSIVLCIEQLH